MNVLEVLAEALLDAITVSVVLQFCQEMSCIAEMLTLLLAHSANDNSLLGGSKKNKKSLIARYF